MSKECKLCQHYGYGDICKICYNRGLWVPNKDARAKTTRGQILNKAMEIINGDRLDTYGNPEDSFALIGEYWTVYLRAKGVIDRYEVIISPREVAEMMMLFKIARMSGQNPNIDNYIDLAGYAAIAADMVDADGL